MTRKRREWTVGVVGQPERIESIAHWNMDGEIIKVREVLTDDGGYETMDYSKTDYAKLWHEQNKQLKTLAARLAALEAAARDVLRNIESRRASDRAGQFNHYDDEQIQALRDALNLQHEGT